MVRSFVAALPAAVLLASAASAAPIAAGSELSINGSDTFVGSPGGASFTLDFVGAGNVGGTSGSFTALANCTACVTMISQLTETSANFELYSTTEGGISSSLTAANIAAFSITAGAGGLESLTITGAGELNLTGFDSVPGSYELTTQGPSGPAEVTFSNTAIAQGVPEPNTLFLLGTGLIGLWLEWRRRRAASRPKALLRQLYLCR